MSLNSEILILGIKNIPIIKTGDDLGKIICACAESQGVPILNNDIIIVTQKIVSKAEGRVKKLKDVKPSIFAQKISKIVKKEPELIELILRESRSIIRMDIGRLITETWHGYICANSGIDKSNVSGGDSVSLLPLDPDSSAHLIRNRIKKLTGKDIAVIITDTFGRPFREGHVDVALGLSGINPFMDMRGIKDVFGYTLKAKKTAIADELASAAELVIGNAKELTPVAIIRGYKYSVNKYSKATKLIRPRKNDLFI